MKKLSDYYDYALKTVINSYPGLFVCASGNESWNLETVDMDFYPAEYSLTNMIVVAASTSSDAPYYSSNYGHSLVDIYAPGAAILSCYPLEKCEAGSSNISTTIHYTNGYHTDSGTSMAAPYVAGVAALILAKHPTATRSQVKSWIMNGADRVVNSNGYDVFGSICASGGRLNAYKAINNHLYTYSKYSATQHLCSCSCGASKRESHTWTTVSTADAETYVLTTYCAKCGYVRS